MSTPIVRILFLTSLLTLVGGCRFFADDNAPCLGDGDCAPFREACVEGRCHVTTIGEGEGEGQGGEGEGEGEGGEGEGEGEGGEGEGEGAAGEGEGEGGEGEGEGGGCVPAAPTREDPGCPGDLFHADFYDGNCVPDLLIGSPGTVTASPADWGGAGVAGIVSAFSSSNVDGLFDGGHEQTNPEHIDAQAGYGAAVALDVVRLTNACVDCRNFVVGEPGRTFKNGTAIERDGQAWQFNLTGVGVGTSVGVVIDNGGFASIGEAVARVPTSANGSVLAFTFPVSPLDPTGGVVIGATAITPSFASPGGGTLGERARLLPDVDNPPDGLQDVAVSAVDLTDATGTYGVAAFSGVDGAIAHRWRAPSTGELFGLAFADLSDVTCDGAPEIVIGAPAAAGGGRIYVDTQWPQGSVSNGPYTSINAPGALSSAAAFGLAIEPIGDLDGDHFEELLVGAPFNDGGGTADVGCADVDLAPAGYAGDCAGAIAIVSGAEIARAVAAGDSAAIAPSCVLEGTDAGAVFGYALRAIGKASGLMRVAVGAPGTASHSGLVRVVTVEMTGGGVCSFNPGQTLTRQAPQSGDRFGFAIAQ